MARGDSFDDECGYCMPLATSEVEGNGLLNFRCIRIRQLAVCFNQRNSL